MKHQARQLARLGTLLLLCMVLAACAGSDNKKIAPPHVVKAFEEVKGDELLLVGKIEVFPPILPKEQYSLQAPHRNQARLIFKDVLKDISQLSRFDDFGQVTVALNEHFFIAVPDIMNNYAGATIVMRIEKSRQSRDRHREIRATLPGGLYVATHGDRRQGTYIGTIRYFRDEFFAITKMEIVDQYDQARDDFVKKFGDQLKLRSSLLQRPTFKNPDSYPGQPKIPTTPTPDARSRT